MTSPAEPTTSANDADAARSDVAKQEAAAVTGTVKEQGSAVTGAVQEGGQRVVAETKNQVGQLTQEAQTQLKEVLGRSQTEFTGRASEQTDKAAVALRDLAGELHALVDGRPKDAPRATGYVRQAADRAEQYAGRLDRDGFAGVADDVGLLARRRPGAFLLGAVAAGFVAGRLARGAKAVSDSDDTPTSQPEALQSAPVTSSAPMRSSAVVTSSGSMTSIARPSTDVPVPPPMDPTTPSPGTFAAPPVDPLAEIMPPGYLAGGPGREVER